MCTAAGLYDVLFTFRTTVTIMRRLDVKSLTTLQSHNALATFGITWSWCHGYPVWKAWIVFGVKHRRHDGITLTLDVQIQEDGLFSLDSNHKLNMHSTYSRRCWFKSREVMMTEFNIRDKELVKFRLKARFCSSAIKQHIMPCFEVAVNTTSVVSEKLMHPMIRCCIRCPHLVAEFIQRAFNFRFRFAT